MSHKPFPVFFTVFLANVSATILYLNICVSTFETLKKNCSRLNRENKHFV